MFFFRVLIISDPKRRCQYQFFFFGLSISYQGKDSHPNTKYPLNTPYNSIKIHHRVYHWGGCFSIGEQDEKYPFHIPMIYVIFWFDPRIGTSEQKYNNPPISLIYSIFTKQLFFYTCYADAYTHTHQKRKQLFLLKNQTQ